MVEHEAAERRELAGIIIELPTELPGPRIGSADVGVAGTLGREQRGAERHLQIQLTLGPLAHIR
jgi:hypothetical protein